MTSTATELKMDTVAKLLLKAESTTPAEAELLTATAEQLIMKYGIERAKLQARKAQGIVDELGQEVVYQTGSYMKPEFDLMCDIGNIFGLKVLVGGNAKKSYVRLIGFKSDIEQAILLFESLKIQGAMAMRKYTKDVDYVRLAAYGSGSDKYNARRSFLFGFGSGATQRLKRARAEQILIADQEAAAERAERQDIAEEAESTGAELVLASRASKVDEYYREQFPRVRTARASNVRRYGSGYSAGSDAGRNARTGEAGIGARKSIG